MLCNEFPYTTKEDLETGLTAFCVPPLGSAGAKLLFLYWRLLLF